MTNLQLTLIYDKIRTESQSGLAIRNRTQLLIDRT